MPRRYNSKSVEIQSATSLNKEELAETVDLLLRLLGKDIVKTTYFSHGDKAINEITLVDTGTTDTGLFEEDGTKTA